VSALDEVTARRLAMLANGYAPLPVIGKMPPLSGWSTIAIDESAIRSWENSSIWPRGTPMSTGARTGETVALDVDIRDAAMADAIEALVRARYGNGAGRLIRRIGQAPKRMFFFGTDAPFQKIQVSFKAPGEDDNEKPHKIEVLGVGQHAVVDGIHPDTGRPYEWLGGEPWTVARSELPKLSQATAAALVGEIARHVLGTKGWRQPTAQQQQNAGGGAQPGADDALIVQLATRLWGPGRHIAYREWRFGTHGSKSVDAMTRRWFDFEANEGGGLRELMAKVDAQGGATAADAPAAPIAIIDLSSWDGVDVPRQKWAVPDRIPAGYVTLFSGEGAAGKSLIQLQLGVAAVLGKSWLGVEPSQGAALIIEAEDDVGIIHKRLADIIHYYGARFADVAGKLHVASLAGEDAVLAGFNRRSGRIEPTRLYARVLEMAGDLKPAIIGIASTANVYAGSEIDRSQVQQFIGLLSRIAMTSGGGLDLVSHPSLTGIASGSGISGTTQWHNAVRARLYITSVTGEDGEEPEGDLRKIVFKKNNYGPMSETIVVRYENGVFVEVATGDAGARAERAKEIFLAILARFEAAGRIVNDKKNGSNYAPRVFAGEDEARAAGLRTKAFETAMTELFRLGRIRQVPYDRRGYVKIVIDDGAPPM
jgi:RecA-family ATPase